MRLFNYKFVTSFKAHTEVDSIRGLHSGKWYRWAGPLRHGWRGGALMEEFTACLRAIPFCGHSWA